jgi:hypothetical protein
MISLILLILSGIFKAIMDVLNFHYSKSIFRKLKSQKALNWFDSSVSWKNKYKNGDQTQGAKFFGSTTFLVWTTDAWHFFQMLFLTTMFLSIVVYVPIVYWLIDFVIYRIVFGFIFELFYSEILESK